MGNGTLAGPGPAAIANQEGSGGLPGGPGGVPPPSKKSEPKPKKKPSIKKVAQQKIQACSSKLTDLKCWTTKLNESSLCLS